ncbi:MAG: DUF3667 domain-containing protein [Chitinophagaceae bacterium]|nr:DUF3667 domain-containing protein [Chitinophagaceae bacterium]
MSHIPQRKEKDCLNCGTIVEGRYCQHCGQENVVPKETFWHMVTHFFYDITHFDSNFFHTIHHLILKPGFLSKEYMIGRRVSYLHPIKMYVFSSAIFFLFFFSFFAPKIKEPANLNTPISPAERVSYIERLQTALLKDTANISLKECLAYAKDTSHEITPKDKFEFEDEGQGIISFAGHNYSRWEEYDSMQQLKPVNKRDGWLRRRIVRKSIDINNAFKEDPKGTTKKFTNSILHRLPYMLFVSLPLFALILRLVYIRRKQFYFADHGVFTIHLYVFSFILLLLVFTLGELEDATGWGFLDYLVGLLFLLLFFYLYKAMRNFYGQSRGKTFLKFLFVALISIIMMLILFTLFMFFSAVTF